MTTLRQIRKVSDAIARAFKPDRIILFGSHASGHAKPDSDVDLFVVMRFKGEAYRKAAEIVSVVDPPFAMDLMVRDPATVQRRLGLGDYFLKDIVEKGRVLYDAADQRVGRKGRSRLRNGASGVAISSSATV